MRRCGDAALFGWMMVAIMGGDNCTGMDTAELEVLWRCAGYAGMRGCGYADMRIYWDEDEVEDGKKTEETYEVERWGWA